MGFIENMIDQAFARMSEEERRDLMQQVANKAMEKMTPADQTAFLNTVIDSFMSKTDAAQKRQLVEAILPRLVHEVMQNSGLSLNELVMLAMKGTK